MNPTLTTREIQLADIPNIADYWLNASAEYLKSIGADKAKLPAREQWEHMLTQQIQSHLAQVYTCAFPERKENQATLNINLRNKNLTAS